MGFFPLTIGREALPSISRVKSLSASASRNTEFPLEFIKSILSKKHGVPPPHEIMASLFSATSWSNRRSISRNPSSPDWANISAIVCPCFSSIYWSRSIKGRFSLFERAEPKVVFPLAIYPMIKRGLEEQPFAAVGEGLSLFFSKCAIIFQPFVPAFFH